MINFLEKAKLLPVFDWNICFFGAHYQQVDKNWKVPIEEHKAFECIYVIDGIEEIIMEKDTIYLKKGDILIIPPGRKHTIKCIDNMEYFCFHFDIDDPVLELILIQSDTYYQNKTKPNIEIKKYLQNLISLINVEQDSFCIKMEIQMILSNFLMYMYDLSKRTYKNSNINQSYYAKVIAEHLKKGLNDKIHAYLNNNIFIDENILVYNIMSKIGLSEGYGTRVFTKYFGVSPRKYLSDLKLSKAKLLLLKPKLSINDISLALGYQNMSSFSRQFKRWVGISPDNYRKEQFRKNNDKWF